MSYAIMDIKGIGPLMADKLKKVGIRTTAKLLETAKSAKGRKELAIKIGVDEKTILRWANLADRMRIKGVGEDYAKLLQAVLADLGQELDGAVLHLGEEVLVDAAEQPDRIVIPAPP